MIFFLSKDLIRSTIWALVVGVGSESSSSLLHVRDLNMSFQIVFRLEHYMAESTTVGAFFMVGSEVAAQSMRRFKIRMSTQHTVLRVSMRKVNVL